MKSRRSRATSNYRGHFAKVNGTAVSRERARISNITLTPADCIDAKELGKEGVNTTLSLSLRNRKSNLKVNVRADKSTNLQTNKIQGKF